MQLRSTFLLCCLLQTAEPALHIDASLDAAGPSATPREMPRTRRERAGVSADVPCLHAITTAPLEDASSAISAYGILFTVSPPPSSSRSDEGLTISSLGFCVNVDKLRSANGVVHYEVHTLSGHYADPDRTNGGNGGLPLDSSWDFRGDLKYWETIAEGHVDAEELVVWPPDDDPVSDARAANHFQIPFDAFQSTSIGGEGVQSFYITLREIDALLYAPLDSWEDMHDEQNVWHCGDALAGASRAVDFQGCVPGSTVDGKPILQIGEGVVGYPFPSVAYFYQPRRFMGSIYYLGECLTDSPSAVPSSTSRPSASGAPSPSPTIVETAPPSQLQRPTPLPKSISLPTTLDYIDAKSDGCHSFISTDRKYESFVDHTSVSASYGMVFPIQSDEGDRDGVWITSLGFHVDFAAIPPSLDDSGDHAVKYEVYALIEDGLYADPNRTPGGSPETFDYRGDFSLWETISTGTIHDGDLVSSANNYFQIPWSKFEPTFIPAYGGIRSLYVTLISGALVYGDLSRKQLGKLHKDDDFKNHKGKTPEPPSLLYGEGVIGYPFRDIPFLYSPKQFIGRIFYEYDCPSQSPSAAPSLEPSESPSKPPSSQPSSMPSFDPTVSHEPTHPPTDSPSASQSPSGVPSSGPTETSNPTGLHFPSISPSLSITPSESPSSHPTASQMPSTSSIPSSPPSLAPSSSAPRMSHSLLGVTTFGALFSTWLLQTLLC